MGGPRELVGGSMPGGKLQPTTSTTAPAAPAHMLPEHIQQQGGGGGGKETAQHGVLDKQTCGKVGSVSK